MPLRLLADGSRLLPALLLCIGCSNLSSARAEHEARLHIGVDLWAGCSPVFLAEQLGYFRDEHVTVDVSIPEDTDQLLVDFAAGSLDGIGLAIGDTINVVEAHPDARIVLISDISDGADVVLAMPPIKRPEDLRGKAVGTHLGGFGELFVRHMLDDHNVPSTAIKVVNVDPAHAVDRLVSGELAAVHTWDPYATRARAAGARVLYTSHDADGLIMDGFIFSGETLRARPTAVRRFLRAWFRAADHWQAHLQEDNQLLAKRLGAAPESINRAGIHLLTLPEEHDVFVSGPSNRSARHVVQQFVDYFLSRGTISAAPDLDQLIDPQFLPAEK